MCANMSYSVPENQVDNVSRSLPIEPPKLKTTWNYPTKKPWDLRVIFQPYPPPEAAGQYIDPETSQTAIELDR